MERIPEIEWYYSCTCRKWTNDLTSPTQFRPTQICPKIRNACKNSLSTKIGEKHTCVHTGVLSLFKRTESHDRMSRGIYPWDYGPEW